MLAAWPQNSEHRNREKDFNAPIVTDEELQSVKNAFNWVCRELTRIIEQIPGATIQWVVPPNKVNSADAKNRAADLPDRIY
jgi:hypothetical protein